MHAQEKNGRLDMFVVAAGVCLFVLVVASFWALCVFCFPHGIELSKSRISVDKH